MIFQATASRSGSESGGTEGRKGYLERNAHKTNGLGVETLVVQVCPEGHGTSAQSRRVFLNRKLRAVKVCSHCNQRTLRCVVAGSVAGNAFVADLSKKRGTIACPRCKAAMEEVVRIAPVQNEPGLIGYECPSCCYVTSVLTPPKSPRRSDE
jgi:transposase-like protein